MDGFQKGEEVRGRLAKEDPAGRVRERGIGSNDR